MKSSKLKKIIAMSLSTLMLTGIINFANDYSVSAEENGLKVQWYQDNDYHRDNDGKHESPEQFYVVLNKPIKNGKFKIVVPNKENDDPYGKGKLLEITGEDLVVTPDPSIEDGWSDGGYSSRYMMELNKDWTRILDSNKTGNHYYDNNIRDIRLIIEGVEVKGENHIDLKELNLKDGVFEGESTGYETGLKVKTTIKSNKIYDIEIVSHSETPSFFRRPSYMIPARIVTEQTTEVDAISGATRSSKGIMEATKKALLKSAGVEEKVLNITSDQDITLLKDDTAPRIVYQYQVSTVKGDSTVYPGTVKFATDEPVQINDPNLKGRHNGMPLTPSEEQGDEVSRVQFKYIRVEDAEGNKVNGEEVLGKYSGGGCLVKASTNGHAIDKESFKYDVYPIHEKAKVKCNRDMGWHAVVPMSDLTSGKWNLEIDGLTDEVGNKMEKHVMENIIIKSGEFFKVDSITRDAVTVTLQEAAEEDKELDLDLELPESTRQDYYILKGNVKKGEKTSDLQLYKYNFDEKDWKKHVLNSIPQGKWSINGIDLDVEVVEKITIK